MKSPETPTLEMPILAGPVSRREDIDAKQRIVARLLADSDCEGLFLLEPMNFRWFTSGALLRGMFGPDEFPGVFIKSTQRWLLCSSVDTQQYFDEELDGLGFQVKEWPWTTGRKQHLTDLCFGRKVACDGSLGSSKQVGAFFEQERRRLSRFEEEQMRLLGQTLVHALEATARNINSGDTEAEIAGHLAHRLWKRGAEPSAVQVVADDRPRDYRRPGVSSTPCKSRCLLQATATRYGLFATASRSVAFGTVDPAVQNEYNSAARLSANWLSSVKAGDYPATFIETQRQLFQGTAFEHEWRLAAPGWWTGRAPSEAAFTRKGSAKLAEGNAVVMRAHIGGCAVADTFVLGANGWTAVTAEGDWPIRRYTLQGVQIDRPDLLVRTDKAR